MAGSRGRNGVWGMTLAELISLRKFKYPKSQQAVFWQGYRLGWEAAYQDLEEILEQNGFDTSVLVMKEGEQK